RAAVVFGAVVGIGIALWFCKLPIMEHAQAADAQAGAKPQPTKSGEAFSIARQARGLPPAFWAYWGLLFIGCGLEFCILFWAPAFLERVIGFDAAPAAIAAAGFPLGALAARIALRVLVRRVMLARLMLAALAAVFLGFLVYWGAGYVAGYVAGHDLGGVAPDVAPGRQAAAVLGVFVIGLGVGPLYPLSTNFAIGAAPAGVPGARDRASMRMAVAFGLSLLLAPIALGALADEIGLGPAHLALPALILAGYGCFFAGRALEKRALIAA
ncbi:MAG TPA: hypothetical protein PLR41_08090, partial [Alphaproteobacteria bacterium]|nr:hypothetical protein [Alphaproteobacteria bacterium]